MFGGMRAVTGDAQPRWGASEQDDRGRDEEGSARGVRRVVDSGRKDDFPPRPRSGHFVAMEVPEGLVFMLRGFYAAAGSR